jgi:hypothetical protein
MHAKMLTNTPRKATLAAASVVTAGIPLVFYLNGPRANWLAHYCHTCGIRLTTYIQEGGAVFPLNSSMLEVPRSSSLRSPPASSGKTTTRLPARLARSPLGPLLEVDFRALASFADRHRSLFPDLILDVDWNRYLDMPVAFRSLVGGTTQSRVYETRFPDFDLDVRLNPAMFWSSKRDPHYFCPRMIWTPERANLGVVVGTTAKEEEEEEDGGKREEGEEEVGLVQLAQAEWDVGMYFPKRERGGAPEKSSGGFYDFRHQEIGLNHSVFARGHPHFVWSSSEGPLLWTIQRAADGLSEGQVAEDRLLLLDCYDRLIAMEHCKYDARWKEWDTVPRDHVFESHLNLRFYGSLPGRVVDEIVVSYVAVSSQLRRKSEWDVVNIETD